MAQTDSPSVWHATLLALALGGAGAFVAALIGLPAPALTGSAIAITLAGLAGLHLDVLQPMRNLAFLIIGMTMGTGVTPDVIESARQWPITFIALAVSTVATFALGALILRHYWRFDRATAILSSTPGHLSYILGLSTEGRGDIAIVSVVQSIRVLALTLLVPFAIAGFGLVGEPGVPRASMALAGLIVTTLGAAGLGFLLQRLRVPAALLLGGMFVSTALHLFGWVAGDVPQWLSWPAFAVMGTVIGTRFSGVRLETLKSSLAAGGAVTFIAFAACLAAALVVGQFVDVPLSHLLVAFAPGGVEAMAATAILMNADPAFVAAHHVWRLTILTFLTPLVLSRDRI
ncbi:MAG: AbrB family transcriptional regulator [Ahrensia sp.]|nr:AbrB family transcriptional regulator [Ahrensia sp.]